MADTTPEIIHQHYADSTAALAAMNDQNWAFEEAAYRLIVMDGATPRYYYPSSYVDSGFIKNQNSSSQTANFDITGDGTFGGTVTAGQVTSTGIMANNLGILSGVSYSVGNSDDGQYVNKSFASTTKNSATAVEFDINLSSMTINAGGSNSNTVFNMFRCDTVNTSTTGVTVRLAELMYGGATKFRVASGGSASSIGGYFYSYGVGDPDSADTEYLQIGHNGTNAFITVGKDGTGAYEELTFNLGGTAYHIMMPDGNVGFNSATTSDYGSGVGVIRIHQAGTAPTTNPTNSILLYVDSSGNLKARGSSGTVTTIAPP